MEEVVVSHAGGFKMLDIPGYRLMGTLRANGSNVLIHAMRESDGLPDHGVIHKDIEPEGGTRFIDFGWPRSRKWST